MLYIQWAKSISNLQQRKVGKLPAKYFINKLKSSHFNHRASDGVWENEFTDDSTWSLRGGYTTNKSETYPRRVLGSGTRASLIVVLRLDEIDEDHTCRGPVQGFKFLLHSPNEVPRVSKNYFSIPLRQEVIVGVKVNMMTTSPNLKSYDPEIRQCFFDGEKKLKFFQIYTQSNCEIECLSNFTLKTCGCVKFSMPHDSDTAICDQSKIQCYNEAEDKLIETELEQGLEFESGKTECNCKPACTSISYNAEISQTDFNFMKVMESLGEPAAKLNDAIRTAKLKIFFKEPQFITAKRSELFGLSDFLANCGGILGD